MPHGVGGAAPAAPADPLTARLAEVSPRQMHDIMVQMRTLAQSNPLQARQLLLSNPALTRALFQAQLMLGMVAAASEGGPPTLPSQPQPLTAAVPPPATTAVAAVPGAMPPALPGGPFMGGPQPVHGYGGMLPPAGAVQPPPPHMQAPFAAPPGAWPPSGMPHHQGVGLPTLQPLRGSAGGAGLAVAAPPPQSGAATVSLGAMDPSQQHALLTQVLRLSDAQVAALPPTEQAQVAQLRHVARQMGLG